MTGDVARPPRPDFESSPSPPANLPSVDSMRAGDPPGMHNPILPEAEAVPTKPCMPECELGSGDNGGFKLHVKIASTISLPHS